MKDMSEISTVKPARAKRTLPSLPKSSKPSNGVFLSPTCSPKTARKNCTNSPLATTSKERTKPSRLPIRRTQSLSEIPVQKSTTNSKYLRKQATINSSELAGNNSNGAKIMKLSTTPAELNKAKIIKNKIKSSNKQPKHEPKIKKDPLDSISHSNSDSSISRILTKSESINSLDGLSGLGLEEENSCVTVAVRVRPFNQR